MVTGRETEHEEVIAERDEEEGRVEDANAKEAEGAGSISQVEEMVEEGFQVVKGEGSGD